MVVYFPFLPVSSGIYTSIPLKKSPRKYLWENGQINWHCPLSPVPFNTGYFELLRTTICLEGELLLSSKYWVASKQRTRKKIYIKLSLHRLITAAKGTASPPGKWQVGNH